MENLNFLTSAGSLVTSLDLKNLGGELSADEFECTFWTRLDGRLGVHYFRLENDVFYQPHTHSEYVAMICLEGELAKTESGQTHAIRSGEVIINHAGVEHSTAYLRRNGKNCEVICVTFDRKILAALAEDFQLPVINGETGSAFTGSWANNLLHDCALEMAQELRRREAGHKTVVEILATRLLLEILRAWPRHQIKTVATDSIARLPARDFIRAYEYMRRCRKGTFCLPHLCSFLGISKERFTRLFLATTNHTPANFYNRMLLERGRELLRDQKLSIKEISFQLGFKTASHFIVAFRREFAAAPQEYRQRDLLGLPKLPTLNARKLTLVDSAN